MSVIPVECIDHSSRMAFRRHDGSDLHKILLIRSLSTEAHGDAGCQPDIQLGQTACFDTMRFCIRFETFLPVIGRKLGEPYAKCECVTKRCTRGDGQQLMGWVSEPQLIAPMAMMSLPDDKKPSACIGCQSCEQVCPQQIKISEAMADFSAKPSW